MNLYSLSALPATATRVFALVIICTVLFPSCDKEEPLGEVQSNEVPVPGATDAATPWGPEDGPTVETVYSYPADEGVEAALQASLGVGRLAARTASDEDQPFLIEEVTSYSDFVPYVEYDGNYPSAIRFIHYNHLTRDYAARTITAADMDALYEEQHPFPSDSPFAFDDVAYAFAYAYHYRVAQTAGSLGPRGGWCPGWARALGLCVGCPSAAGGCTKKMRIRKNEDGGGNAPKFSFVYAPGPGGRSSGTTNIGGGSGSGGSSGGGGGGGSGSSSYIDASKTFLCQLRKCGWRGYLGSLSCDSGGGSGPAPTPGPTLPPRSSSYLTESECEQVNSLYGLSTSSLLRAAGNLDVLQKIMDHGMASAVQDGLRADGTDYERALINYYEEVGPSAFNVLSFGFWYKSDEAISRELGSAASEEMIQFFQVNRSLATALVRDLQRSGSDDSRARAVYDELMASSAFAGVDPGAVAQEALILSKLYGEGTPTGWTMAKVVARAVWNVYIDDVHTVLDLVGLIPGIGEPADLINGGLYVIEGDALNASISFAATVPVVGSIGTGGRLITRVASLARKADGTFLPLVYHNVNGIISFCKGGGNAACRGDLRKVLGGVKGDGMHAHHILPIDVMDAEPVQQLARGGDFHMNEALNGILIRAGDHLPGHAAYTIEIRRALESAHANGMWAGDAIPQLIAEARAYIQRTGGVVGFTSNL